MKKLIVMVICVLFLTGCTTSKNLEDVNESVESATFNLVADRTTGIIYIKNKTYSRFYVYTPYYSENGKLCKFVDNKIVEVSEDEK